MGSLDWKRIMAIVPTELDEAEADAIYEIIIEFSPQQETNVGRLQKLCEVTQALLSIKATQFEIANEELEGIGAKAGRSGAEQVQKYVERIADLEGEIRELKRFGGGASKDTRFVREEIHDLERQVEMFQDDLKNAERELRNEKEQGERYASRVEELEKEVSDLKRENDMHQDEIRDYRQQVDSVRERMQLRRGEDADFKEKITKKNRELVEALDEIQQMTDANVELRGTVDELTKKLEDAVKQMEKTTFDHTKLKAFVNNSDENINVVRRENDLLKVRVADLQEKLQTKQSDDDDIMMAVNEKVEEWKQLLAEKDAEVLDYHQQVRAMKEQIAASNIDSERTSIAVLTKAVAERDKQIMSQLDEISRARADLESTSDIIENLRKDLQKSGKGPSNKQVLQIRDLSKKLSEMTELAEVAQLNMRKAEDDASEKDKVLNHHIQLLRRYEDGEYGLKEAVDEIKGLKVQVVVRDRQISELTQHVNTSEMKCNDLSDENEQLREKLGLNVEESVDLASYRMNKNTMKQTDRALNQALCKEIEKLEEERLELKREIRALAQKTGQRAAALGINDDEEFMESTLGRKYRNNVNARVAEDKDPNYAEKYKHDLQGEIDRNAQLIEKVTNDNKALRMANEKLVEENSSLQQGVEEVFTQVKEGNLTSAAEVLQTPTMDKLVTMMEAKRVGGNYDAVVYQKARADSLEGRVDELRRELQEYKNEHSAMKLEVSKLELSNEKLRNELLAAKEPLIMSRAAYTMPLPKTMTATSSEIVASVNECLINVMQDVHLKEELLQEMTEKLEIYKRKFAVVRHQLGDLYQNYLNEKKTWEEEKQNLEKKVSTLSDERAVKDVRLVEFDRMLSTLHQDDSEIRRQLAEDVRNMTVVKVNEVNLTRRYNALLDIETATRRENAKLRSEMIDMELKVTERIGYLLRYKDMAAFKIEHLHRELENSVSAADLQDLSKKHCELTEKYRDLLQKGNLLVAKNEELRTMEVENDELKRFSEELKKVLEIEKEKSHLLETRLNLLGESSGIETSLSQTQTMSISKKLTLLEMKELNERQRAEHATKMYEHVRSTIRVLETRNSELETKFAEITETVLTSQRTEQKLRDELEGSVSKAESDRDRAKILQLENADKLLRDEIVKLKQISEVSLLQSNCLDAQQVSRDKEILSMRQQLIDIQQYSDEKSIIGKLHRQIVRLQVSESTAVRKYEQSKKRILSLEAHVLRLEEVIDDKEDTYSHKQAQQRNTVKNLKKTIQSLRTNFSGAIPLRQVERMSKATADLLNNRAVLQSQLKRMQDEKTGFEDKLAEMQLKHAGLNELICTLQDGVGAQKVSEWHEKMESLRLVDLKLKRNIRTLNQQCVYLEGVITEHETNIQALEEENVKLTRDFDERQVLWEQREIKLESRIESLERNEAKITSAAASFTAVSEDLPDSNMPVSEQLDIAVTTIKKNVKTILDTKSENVAYKKKHTELTENLKRLERDLLTKERIIAEMRLRMPASSDRDGIISLLVEAASNVEHEVDSASSPSLKMAQSTLASLQDRIAQKEETIAKYQNLLSQVRNDLNIANKRHDEELYVLQTKLRSTSESALARFKQLSQEIMRQPIAGPFSKQELMRLAEFEDIVCQQDNSIAALAEKLKQSRTETGHWQRMYDNLMVDFEHEKTASVAAIAKTSAQNQETHASQNKKIGELSQLVSELEKDLQIQKSMNERAPSATMRNIVDKLKNQLELKEKQHASLTQALSEVRGDMLAQAEAYVIATNEGAKSENNVQKLISKQTAGLQDELIEAKKRISLLSNSVKRHQEGDEEMKRTLNNLQNIIKKKEKQIQSLNADKLKLEEGNLELENRCNRLKAARSGPNDSKKIEVENLKRIVATLEDELKQKQELAEKPYEQGASTARTKWEGQKAMQKTVNQLKAQLREVEDEVNDLKRQLELTKKALITANKDKQTLRSRLKLKQPNTNADSMQRSDNFLNESVPDSSEPVYGRKVASTLTVDPTNTASINERDQHSQVRRLTEENIELRFERDSMQKDIPRLKSRIQDLHNYIEVLRTENADLKGTTRSLSSSGASSGLKRLGESGKSTRELEKTIILLKKVIERLQLENDRLKKSPGVLSNNDYDSLHLENEGLKNQLSELREKFGATLSNRYESSQKGISKMRDEYDKIRQDLLREVEVNQKLRVENRHLEIGNEQLKNELTVLKSRLEIKEGAQKFSEGVWSSTLSQKMVEERVRSLLADNDKNTELIDHLKVLLKESAVREQSLKQEVDSLKISLDGNDVLAERKVDHPFATERGLDNLLHEVVDLQLDNKQLILDRGRLQEEILKFKRQFEKSKLESTEYAQLQVDYQELLAQNANYERKIQQVEKQFGVKL